MGSMEETGCTQCICQLFEQTWKQSSFYKGLLGALKPSLFSLKNVATFKCSISDFVLQLALCQGRNITHPKKIKHTSHYFWTFETVSLNNLHPTKLHPHDGAYDVAGVILVVVVLYWSQLWVPLLGNVTIEPGSLNTLLYPHWNQHSWMVECLIILSWK